MQFDRDSEEAKLYILRRVLSCVDRKYVKAQYKIEVNSDYGYKVYFKLSNGKTVKFETDDNGNIGVIE